MNMTSLKKRFNQAYFTYLKDITRKGKYFDKTKEREKLYLMHHRKRFLSNIIRISPFLKKTSKILDVGTSPFTFILKEIFPEIDLTTVDLTNRMETVCQKKEIKFLVWDITKMPLPFKDESFNIVFLCEVLEHLLADHGLILKEFERILKKKGKIILQTPNWTALNQRLKVLLGINIQSRIEVFLKPKLRVDNHVYEYTLPELIDVIKKKTNLKILSAGYPDYYDNLESSLVYRTRKLLWVVPLMFYCLITKMIPNLRRGIEIVLEKE